MPHPIASSRPTPRLACWLALRHKRQDARNDHQNSPPPSKTYLTDLRRIRASGGATGERSYYPALAALLNAVGGALKPKTFCVAELAAQGAGHPDFGLYAAKQVQKGQPKEGQVPERGVVEVKSASDNVWLTAESAQVSRYWERLPSRPGHQHARFRVDG